MQLFRPIKRMLIVPFLILSLILAVACLDYLYFRNRIYPGIQLKNIDLKGNTLGDVELVLDNIEIVFIGPESMITTMSLREMGIIPRVKQIFDTAFSFGRIGPWPRTYIERLRLAREGTEIPFSYYLDEGLLDWGTGLLENNINSDPVDAFFKINLSRSEIQDELVPERYGYMLDKHNLLLSIQQVLNDPHSSFVVEVPMEKISPDITISLLKEKGIESLASSCSTRFDPMNTNRVHNIELAASHLHNYLLAPGEILSLNALIGDTTPEKGYREAFVMVGNELVPGYGGGVCQISTTLYNAALLANLQIIERHNHHMSIPYIAPGRDATIVYGVRDLKFRNNRDHHIFINADVDYDKLRFSLFGTPMEENVIIDTQILAVYEPPVRYFYTPEVSLGEEDIIEGSPGYLVEVWKYVYRGEEELGRKIISVDSYTPHPTITRRHSPIPWR